MRPKICFSIGNLKEFSFEEFSFEGYEIKADAPGFSPNVIVILKLKDLLKGKDFSLHSGLSRIFSCNDKNLSEFSEAELEILKSEIIISKILGIKQINFHMKEGKLTDNEIKEFKRIIRFANKNGIEMIYENHVCSEETIFNILDCFPKVNFCLDLGHLNLAIHEGKFKMNIEKFLKRVKSRLVHIHAHNNHGIKDEHNDLEEGNLDWKKILIQLEKSNLKKIIIENRTKKEADKSKRLLEEYYYKKE